MIEFIEKRTRAETLRQQAQQQLREVALDFGMQFARSHRQRIENFCTELSFGIEQNNEAVIDSSYTNLQNALYELDRDVQEYYAEAEDEDLFGAIRNIFTRDDEDDDDNYNSSPVIKPRRPGSGPGTLDSAVLPPVDD